VEGGGGATIAAAAVAGTVGAWLAAAVGGMRRGATVGDAALVGATIAV
jgi:hypothetical protein